MFAILDKNQLIIDLLAVDPYSIHRPEYAAQFLAVPDNVALGWRYADDNWIAPEAKPLEQLQREIITAIRAERDRRKLNGVQVKGKWIHTDVYSRTQWMSMKIMGESVPKVNWTSMDGTTIAISANLVNEVFDSIASLDASLFKHAQELIQQVQSSTQPQQIDIHSGWPDTYQL